MKPSIIFVFLLFAFSLSCNNKDEKRDLENARELKKKSVIFANINKSWVFNTQPINSASAGLLTTWAPWRTFITELSQKPKSTMGAFQQKAKNLSKRVADLNLNVPPPFNNPAIRSRITVLVTKMNMLDLYIHLGDIPDQKVVGLIQEINKNLNELQLQMDEVVRKNKIQVEEGEQDMLRMMDPARAIPTPSQNPGQPNPQIDPAPRPFHVR